jgi:cytochrome c oxidase subunit 3
VDWLTDFELPTFYYSTIVIIGCSITFHLAKAIQKTIKAHYYISFATLALGILFVILQGFGQIVQDGYYFTGSESSITTTSLCCDRSALNSPCRWGNFIADYNL